MENYDEKIKLQTDSYDTIAIDNNNANIDLDNKTIDLTNTTGDNSQNQVPNTANSESQFQSTSIFDKVGDKYQMLCERITQASTAFSEKIDIAPSYKYFVILMGIGLVFIMLSLTMLPLLVLSPTKFVLTFGTGNLLILISFVFYFGGKEYVIMLFSEKRRYMSIGFVLSLLFGLFFAWRKHYILSLLFALVQMGTVIIFSLSFIPGGNEGIKFIGSTTKGALINLFTGLKNKFTSQQKSDLPI